MSPNLITRRSLAVAAGAVLGTAALPAGATIARLAETPLDAARETTNLDAALLSLIAQHGPALARCRALVRESDRIVIAYFAALPTRPADLRWRHDDHFGVGWMPEEMPSGKVRIWYDAEHVERISRLPVPASISTALVPAWEGRRHAVITAHEAWEAECAAIADRYALAQTEIETDAAADALFEMEQRIVGTVAQTVTGLAAKAAWLIAADRTREDGEAFIRQVAAFAQAGA